MSETSNHSKQAVLCCMDGRHQSIDGLFSALRAADVIHQTEGPYTIALAGGAGNFASINDASREVMLGDLTLGINKAGVKEIILTVHGISVENAGGCAGYARAHLLQDGKTPEESFAFSADELRKAEAFLRATGITLPIRMFIVTFAVDGSNLLKEIFLDSAPIPKEEMIAA